MNKLRTIAEFWHFLLGKKKYWLLPVIIVLVLLGVIVVLGENSVIAPFIYSLF